MAGQSPRSKYASRPFLARRDFELFAGFASRGRAWCQWASMAILQVRIPGGYGNGIMTGVRMDKWLWAARFFKTRSLAGRACELGRIESNGQPAKAAREGRGGDLLQVKND